MKSQQLKLVLAGLLAVASVPAHAVLITSWTATFNNGFDQSLTQPVGPITFVDPNPVGPNLDSFKELRWGVPLPPNTLQSGLRVDTATPSGAVTVVTSNDPIITGSITHFNNVIRCAQPADTDCAGALTRTTLHSELTLQTLTPVPPPVGTVVIPPSVRSFNIQFVETRNLSGLPGCGIGGSDTDCDDIFILLNPIALTDQFVFDGITYNLSISAFLEATDAPLAELPDGACARAGLGEGCIGFLTLEGQNNIVRTTIEIHAAVPEPGSVALLGAVLVAGAGVIAVRRRRKS